MASSPLHNLIPRSSSLESNSNNNNGYITKERTNTFDSTNSNNGIGIFSPSYSKEDYDSDDNDSQHQQHPEEDQLLNTTTTNEEEEEDLMGSSGMLILEALAPGESSSPIRNSSSSQRKYDLCGSMYKRRGGFGRNKENNWYDIDVYIVFISCVLWFCNSLVFLCRKIPLHFISISSSPPHFTFLNSYYTG